VRVEVSDVGGGRVDVVVDLGDDRVVIQCKRDRDPWALGPLDGWAMQADAYLATRSRIGLLVLLDLSDKAKGRPTDLSGSPDVLAAPLALGPRGRLRCRHGEPALTIGHRGGRPALGLAHRAALRRRRSVTLPGVSNPPAAGHQRLTRRHLPF
jgi:hypothetical protein